MTVCPVIRLETVQGVFTAFTLDIGSSHDPVGDKATKREGGREDRWMEGRTKACLGL